MGSKTIKAGTAGVDVTVDTDSGASGADTQRVILATNDPAVAKLGTIDGHVDGLETLMAGGLPVALGAGGGLKIDGSGTALPTTLAAKSVLWKAAVLSRGTVLTTELNSLASAAYSGVGPAFDNTVNLDQWFWADYVLASLNPSVGAYLQLFFVPSLDGSNFADPPASTNPGINMLVDTVTVTTGSAAKRVMTTQPFRLPPCKGKFVLLDATGVNLAASANTVTLYSGNDGLI